MHVVSRSCAAVAALLLATASAWSASAVEPGGDDREQQLVLEIQRTLTRDGPYSAALLPPLVGLSELYEETGDHVSGLVVIEQALQVVRANDGLHTLKQVPWVWQKIRHEEARGNHEAAWNLEQDLLTLTRRYPDDLRTVPLLRELADRRMATLREYLAGDKPPEVRFGCFYQDWPAGGDGSCTAGMRQTVVRGMLGDAQSYYARAIGTLLQHGAYGSAELRDIEMQLLRGVDMMRTRYEGPGEHPVALVPGASLAAYVEPWRSRVAPLAALAAWHLPDATQGVDDEGGTAEFAATESRLTWTYFRGRHSLRRLYVYEAAVNAAPTAQADALAQIADWDLLYSRNGLAVEGYAVAHAMLRVAGVPVGEVEQLFATETPVVLPAFQPNPLLSDEAQPATGYIDVTFAISKYGRAQDFAIGDTANATEAAQRRLARLVNSSRFRPRLTADGRADATPVAVHYVLHD